MVVELVYQALGAGCYDDDSTFNKTTFTFTHNNFEKSTQYWYPRLEPFLANLSQSYSDMRQREYFLANLSQSYSDMRQREYFPLHDKKQNPSLDSVSNITHDEPMPGNIEDFDEYLALITDEQLIGQLAYESEMSSKNR